VILELELPDMSGFEVLTKLVPIARRPEVPAIVLTKFDNQALLEVPAKSGALVTLQKSTTSGDDLDRIVLKAIATVQRDGKKTWRLLPMSSSRNESGLLGQALACCEQKESPLH